MNPIIIGLCGGIGAGKDCVADYLIERHGYRRVAFADALKECVASVYGKLGVPRRHFFGSQANKAEPITILGGVTGRRILEVVGTEGFRAAYADTWVRVALADAFADSTEPVVTTDVRFPNEYDAIRKAGGQVWRVRRIRPRRFIGGFVDAAPSTGHESDVHWRRLKPDAELRAQQGELPALYAQAAALLEG